MDIKKILHVDDKTSLRLGFRMALTDAGFSYKGVSSLEEFSFALGQFNPDICIIDGYFFEKKDGTKKYLLPQAEEEVRSKVPNARIIVNSALSESKIFAEEKGYSFLPKPCLPNEVYETIDRLIK